MSDDRDKILDNILAEYEGNLTPEDESLLEDIVMDLDPKEEPYGTLRAVGIHKGPEQKDPGSDKYNFQREEQKRELMQQAAFYAESGPTFDPEGKYLCGSCYYRQLMDWGDTPYCYIVDGKVSMETGSCSFYRHGNPDSEWNPLPTHHRYSKEASGYAERPKVKGFGCYPRCKYGKEAEQKDSDGREYWCLNWGVHVTARACCAFEEGEDLVQIEAGGEGSGCNPEVAEEHGTTCGPKAGPPKHYFLHEKVGGAQGSNPGGMFKGTDGIYRYVKFYADEKQSRGEHLANHIYNEIGVDAPHSQLFEHNGKDAIAAPQMEGKTVQQMGAMTPEQAKTFMNGFAADVLTANWDAVGTGKDNVFIHQNGNVVRLDQGGTFLKRAQGGDKPEALLNKITEADKFFDASVNKHYADVAQKAGVKSAADLGEQTGTKSLQEQVGDIVALRQKYGDWASYISAKDPDMPMGERAKIALMLEARTNLLKNLAEQQTQSNFQKKMEDLSGKPTTSDVPKTGDKTDTGKKYQARVWGEPNPKLIGGYFRQNTVLASVYSTLAEKQGEWHSISKIKADLEQKFGKSLYNISQNTLKQGGKKTGLWSVEISGDSIRLFMQKALEKGQTAVVDVSDSKQTLAASFAKKAYDTAGHEMDTLASQKLHYDLFNQMDVSPGSKMALEHAVKIWTGSNNDPSAQNWRQVAMEYYHRNPDNEYTSYSTKVIGTAKGNEKAAEMKAAAMALKAYSGEFAKLNNVNIVYRNIAGDQAREIVAAMREAEKKGLTKVKIANNAISCWSDRADLGISSSLKIRMKVDPDNIWASHQASPHLFTAHKGEKEWMVGMHNPFEEFDFKDISVLDAFGCGATKDEYNKWHRVFKKGEIGASAVKKMVQRNLDPKADPVWYAALQKAQAESEIPIANCVLDDHWMYEEDEKNAPRDGRNHSGS